MAITITDQGESPGLGRKSPLYLAGAARAPVIRIYRVAFDDSYPTGGESIASIWSDLKSVTAIFVQAADATINDNRLFSVDFTNKKLIVLTDINTEAANESDQSGLGTVQLLVIGYE